MKSPLKSCFDRFPAYGWFLLSLVLYWLALPPVNCCWLAFSVPVCWVKIWKREESFSSWDYLLFWGISVGFWMSEIIWVSYPHAATILGWLALSCYLGIYFPLLIGVTRILNRCFRVPLILAVLIGFLASEWGRNHGLGGFSFASLEHAFYRHPLWIQLADILNEYGVGGMILLVGTLAGLLIWEPCGFRKKSIYLTSLVLVLVGTVIYGNRQLAYWRDQEETALKQGTVPIRIAILQNARTFSFPVPMSLNTQIHQEYEKLSNRASRETPPPDLIIWPESCFGDTWFDLYSGGAVPFSGSESLSREQWQEASKVRIDEYHQKILRWVQNLKTPVILGLISILGDSEGNQDVFNSALFLTPDGEQKRYDKVHLVMFGEYVPLVEYLPDWFPLKTLCSSVDFGKGPIGFPLRVQNNTYYISPNICFESTVARLLKKQIRELATKEENPSILVNLSNDGWFREGMQIDGHLATHVFRAVENRRTVLSATHGGFSVWIDPAGRIRQQGARNSTEIVWADVVPLPTPEPVFHPGDWLPGLSAALGGMALVFQLLFGWFFRKKKAPILVDPTEPR